MVTKKTTAAKAKSSTSKTGKAAKKPPIKAEVKVSPAKSPAPKAPGAKAQAAKAPLKGDGKAAPVDAKASVPKAAVPPAQSAPRGRPGRKPKQTEEQLLGDDPAVPEAGDDTADPSVQIVEKMSATKLRDRAGGSRAGETRSPIALRRGRWST